MQCLWELGGVYTGLVAKGLLSCGAFWEGVTRRKSSARRRYHPIERQKPVGARQGGLRIRYGRRPHIPWCVHVQTPLRGHVFGRRASAPFLTMATTLAAPHHHGPQLATAPPPTLPWCGTYKFSVCAQVNVDVEPPFVPTMPPAPTVRQTYPPCAYGANQPPPSPKPIEPKDSRNYGAHRLEQGCIGRGVRYPPPRLQGLWSALPQASLAWSPLQSGRGAAPSNGPSTWGEGWPTHTPLVGATLPLFLRLPATGRVTEAPVQALVFKSDAAVPEGVTEVKDAQEVRTVLGMRTAIDTAHGRPSAAAAAASPWVPVSAHSSRSSSDSGASSDEYSVTTYSYPQAKIWYLLPSPIHASAQILTSYRNAPAVVAPSRGCCSTGGRAERVLDRDHSQLCCSKIQESTQFVKDQMEHSTAKWCCPPPPPSDTSRALGHIRIPISLNPCSPPSILFSLQF